MTSDISFFDNVFDEQFCRFLLNDARSSLARDGGFARTNQDWDEAVRKSSATVHVRDHEPVLAQMILAKLIDRGVVSHPDFRVMTFAWMPLSYIPWHDDYRHDEAATIYLNEHWDKDWGGLFLYQAGESDIRAVAPSFNSGLSNRRQIEHATTIVSTDAPEPRFSLQLFSKRKG